MNAIIKIASCDNFYTTKVKKGKETKVPAMYNSLTLSNKMVIKEMVYICRLSHAVGIKDVNRDCIAIHRSGIHCTVSLHEGGNTHHVAATRSS